MKILLLAIIVFLLAFISLNIYLETPNNVRIVNFTDKAERVLYSGSVENVKIIYSSLKNDYDIVKIIIFDNKKEQIYNRVLYRKNIKIIFY